MTDAAHETGGIIRLTHTMNIIWLAGISSGGYDEDIDRKWFIVARHIAIIRILFTGPFEIEQSPDGNCTQDSLTVSSTNM